MKQKYIILLVLILSLFSCENQDWEYKDYDFTSCYFPYQTPVRTLILGNYDQGFNDNDNNHRFEIGAVLSGVYSNESVRKVYFQVDESLLDNVSNVTALPGDYYQIETENPVLIPAGSTKAIITVQLTDQFFEDPNSFAPIIDSVNYVIPILITDYEDIDSVLSGVAADAVDDPIRTNVNDWEVLPKDYTLFGIKYINEFHGNYLRRGVDILTTAADSTFSNVYHAKYVERDELTRLATSGKNSVTYSNRVRRGDEESPGDVSMELSFDGNNACTITHTTESPFAVQGSGEFVADGDSWGGESKDAIYLQYTYSDTINSEQHEVYDTLVIRDRDVVFETFTIIQ